MSPTFRFRSALAIAALVTGMAGPAAAVQSTRQEVPPGPKPGPETALVERVASDVDAAETREKLEQLLQKYPPSLGRVLKLDPSLMANQSYMATYPAMSAFLAQHPEVAHNPGFFLENVRISTGPYTVDNRTPGMQLLERYLDNFTAFLVFLVVTATLIWLVRTALDHRRWNRLSKVQTDVHTKLLEKLGSNEELLRYAETPAGRRFLESAPIALEPAAPRMSAPFSRILWSIQAGAVLGVAGLGLLYVSSEMVDEIAQFFFSIGVLTLALGVGFGVSAAISFFLSRRLGLFEPAATDHA